MRHLSPSFAVICAFASLACGQRPGQLGDALPETTGTASFALTQTDYKLVASFDVLKDGVESTATLAAYEDAGASHTLTLPIGSYTLDLLGGDFDDTLDAYTTDQGGSASAPYCVYTGPNVASLGPLTGCTITSYNPDPFVVRANDDTDVDIEVTFHFEQDVVVSFSTGRATFHLAPADEQYCGATGVVCALDEVCSILDDVTPPACLRVCNFDLDCEVGQSCVLSDLMGGDGTGPSALSLCR